MDKSSSPQDISRKVRQTGLTQNHAAVQLKSLLRADKWQEVVHCMQLISIHESHLSLNPELLPVTNRAKASLLQKSQANLVSCCRGVKLHVKPVAAACMGGNQSNNQSTAHPFSFSFSLMKSSQALLPKLNPICSCFPFPSKHSSASHQTSLKS